MNSTVNWSNPYADCEGRWYRGDLHVHCSEGSGCAKMAFAEAVEAMVAEGLDFVSFSDHFVLTALRDARLTLIPGMEWTGMNRRHTGIYHTDPEMIERVRRTAGQDDAFELFAREGGFTVANHPDWKDWDHYLQQHLDESGPYSAVEIYNATGETSPGGAEATGKWDHVLTRGRRVLGVAGSDAHRTERIGKAWIAVRAPARSADAIFAAIVRGNVYASSGVALSDIRREDERVEVTSENAQEIRLVGTGGRMLESREDDSAVFDLSRLGDEITYVRLEAFGPGASKAWTQPFFL